MANSNHMSTCISHRLGDICTSKFFPYLLSLGQNFPPPRTTRTPRAIFLKIESLHPCVRGKASTKYEVDWLNTFSAIVLTDTQTHRYTDAHSDCKKPLITPRHRFNGWRFLLCVCVCVCVFVGYENILKCTEQIKSIFGSQPSDLGMEPFEYEQITLGYSKNGFQKFCPYEKKHFQSVITTKPK